TLVNGSWAATHVVVDVAGYVLPGWGAGSFSAAPVFGGRSGSLACADGTSCVVARAGHLLTSRGDTWTSSPAPRPAGTTAASVDQVACAPDGTCAGRGRWAGSDSSSGTLVATRSSGTWAAHALA